MRKILLIVPLLLGVVAACGPKTPPAVQGQVGSTTVNPDTDPESILPGGAIGVAKIDVKQLAAKSVGGDLVTLAQKYVPFAADIGFDFQRDVDTAYVAAYSFTGADALVVLSGRFNSQKIESVLSKGPSAFGNAMVASQYANHNIYTVANIGFCVLSDHTLLAGTETAMRHALDRIKYGTLNHALDPIMAAEIDQPNYALLMAVDVRKAPLRNLLGATGYDLMAPALSSLQFVRARGGFNGDGSFGVSSACTYETQDAANKAAATLSDFRNMINGLKDNAITNLLSTAITTFAPMIPGLKDLPIAQWVPVIRTLVVSTQGKDVQLRAVFDEQTARQLIALLANVISVTPAPSGSK
jgi:hypothetical protein